MSRGVSYSKIRVENRPNGFEGRQKNPSIYGPLVIGALSFLGIIGGICYLFQNL